MIFQIFTLENYKGISDKVTIDLTEGKEGFPYSLVGNNESGKTTILKGIELIGQLCSGLVLQNGKLASIRPKEAYFNGETTLSAIILLDQSEIDKISGQGKANIQNLIINNGNKIEIKFIYKFNNSSFEEHKRKLIINTEEQTRDFNIFEIITTNAPEIIYYDDFKFDVPDKIRFLKKNIKDQKPELAKDPLLNSEQNVLWQKIFNDLLIGSSKKSGKAQSNQFQRDIIDWSSENEGDEDAVDQRLVAINDYLNNVITNDWEDITGEKSVFDRFNIKRTNSINTDFIDFSLKVEAKGKSFSLHERSKGCKWFFCFKILTDIRKHRNDKGTLFLLDEPASNLHIHPQEKILTSLEKLSATEKSSVIFSTHSPFLIQPENKENIFVVSNISDDSDDSPKIVCDKLKDYKLTSEKSIRSIEPILNKIASSVIISSGATWKERLSKLPKIAGGINECIDLLKNIFEFSKTS